MGGRESGRHNGKKNSGRQNSKKNSGRQNSKKNSGRQNSRKNSESGGMGGRERRDSVGKQSLVLSHIEFYNFIFFKFF